MRSGSPLLVVLGALLALVGLGFLAAGTGASWVHASQRDADGFYTSPTYELATDGYAITTEEVHLVARPGDWFPAPGELTIRIEVDPAVADQPVFLGVAAQDDVEAFLDGVAHSELARLGTDAKDVTYRSQPGTTAAEPPGDQDLWIASVEGAGPQVLTLDPTPGDWALVVMNADAAPGVEVAASAGVRSGILLPVGIGLLVTALLLLAGATTLLVLGATTTKPDGQPVPTPAPLAAGAGTYPVVVEARLDPELSRGMWLVKWLLALPHVLVLALLWPAFAVMTVVAGFAILFTGRYPRAIFDFNVGVMRWTWRVAYYAYGVLGTDRYPPFTLAHDPDYPATLDVVHPEELSRGLVLVKWWLLAIPHYLVVGVFTGGLVSWTADVGAPDGWQAVAGTGLIGVLVLVAAVALLVTGRYPSGLHDLVMGLQRWVYRVMAYAALMTDEYPPFRLDTGGAEPSRPHPDAPAGPTVEGGGRRELTHT